MTAAASLTVLFRVDSDGFVFALFPDDPDPATGFVDVCTPHGHTSGPLAENLRHSRAATPDEYAPLLREMNRAGYAGLLALGGRP